MMNRILTSIIFTVSLAAFIGCSSKKDDNNDQLLALALLSRGTTASSVLTPQNLPTKSTIDTPKSVTAGIGSGTQASTRLQRAGENTAWGYQTLTQSAKFVNQVALYSALEMLLNDKTVPQAKATPGTCIPGADAAIEFDDSFLAAIRFILESQGYAGEQLTTEIKMWEGLKGAKLARPSITYTSLSNDPAGYTHQYAYSYDVNDPTKTKACPTAPATHDFSIKTTDNNKSLFYGGGMSFGTGAEKFTVTFTLKTDLDKITMIYTDKVAFGDMKMSSNVKTQACDVKTYATNPCWQADVGFNMSGTPKFGMNFLGRMDNSGGVVGTRMDNFTNPGQKDHFLEQFDGAGKLTRLLSCGTDSTFKTCTALVGTTVTEGELGEYSDFNTAPADIPVLAVVINSADATKEYVILEKDKNPATNPEAILGMKFPGEEPSYWGVEAQITNLDVWEITGFDPDTGEPKGEIRAALTVAKK